jgi:apolipoprotein N-acyltransferase
LWWRLSLINTTQFLPHFAGGFFFGLAYFVIGLWWIFISLHDIGGMNAALSVTAVVLLSAYMALFFGLASALGIRLQHRHFFLSSAIMAAAWVLMEYLRGQLFTGFPWVGFADAQVNGPFAAIAPLLGGLGSTFLVVWASMQLSRWRQSRVQITISIGLALLVMLGLYQLRFTEATGNPISVRLIQGNFEQSLKWNPSAIAQQIRFYSDSRNRISFTRKRLTKRYASSAKRIFTINAQQSSAGLNWDCPQPQWPIAVFQPRTRSIPVGYCALLLR